MSHGLTHADTTGIDWAIVFTGVTGAVMKGLAT